MIKGILFVICACFAWGLIFIIPGFIKTFSSIEIVLGRYFFYGIISALFFFKERIVSKNKYPFFVWIKAFKYSFLITISYYICVLLGLSYSQPSICALILGISPITIAFYGNRKEKECSFSSLLVPSALILIGMFIINVPHFIQHAAPSAYLLGLIFSVLALIIWSWFAVANSLFLKKYPEIHPSQWSTLVGFATLFWVLAVWLIAAIFFEEKLHVEKYFSLEPVSIIFLLGCFILGIVCSWLGSVLWNKASLHLPISLVGQLMIFETIFGLLFISLFEQRWPSTHEFFGIAILLGAIAHGAHIFYRTKKLARLDKDTVT